MPALGHYSGLPRATICHNSAIAASVSCARLALCGYRRPALGQQLVGLRGAV